ncbi:alpha-1D adrenergic receptor-like [Stylophora pistillata]|uniref:alpha-1D adrenergic receptor-like n=1 Tax=Stylophora pistillata TaxID=50429 RepID=UPI000C04F230|nr:alpha-1D adrenergic receptor-like [Stylophora pistillata]
MSWYICSSLAVGFVAVTGNGVVAWLIVTQSKLHTVTNWFILSLAVSDLMVGLSIAPADTACKRLGACDVYLQGAFKELFLYESIYSLCAMTADRFIAIAYPLKYPNFMTFRCTVTIIALSWFVPLFNFCLHFFWLYAEPETRKTWYRIFTITETIFMVAVPCILLTVANIKIIRVAQLQSKRATVQLRQVNFNRMDTFLRKPPRKAEFKYRKSNSRVHTESEDKPSSEGKYLSRLEMRGKEEFRGRFPRRKLPRSSIKVTVAVITIFLGCWALSLYVSLCNYFDLCNLSPDLINVTWLLMLLNPATNPIVFISLKSDLRAELSRKMATLKSSYTFNKQTL